jgi:glutathione S-transferase
MARFILNYKGIPHRTEWIEYPDIEPHNKSLGIKPTGKKADGTPRYTLPAIHDPSTNTYLADSFLIAEYLEETYPDTPRIFPHETRSLQHAFQSAFVQTLGPVRPFVIPVAWLHLGQRSKEFYRFHRELDAGHTLEEMVPVGTERVVKWAKFREAMNTVNESLAKTDAKGPFVMGDTISWADIFLSAYLTYFKLIWGEDSEEWKDMASWNGGRWENLLRSLGNQTIN